MGYCFEGRRLVCDGCGRAEGTTRKRKCPEGWCQAAALCPECWKGAVGAEWRAPHESCAKSHAVAEEQDARKRAILVAGGAVRVAAIATEVYGRTNGVPDPAEKCDAVLVVFRGGNGQEKCFLMAHATYDAIQLLEPATPDDYAKHGHVVATGRTWEEDYARVLRGEAVECV